MPTGPFRSPFELAVHTAPSAEGRVLEGALARGQALASLHQRCARGVFGYVWRRTGDRHIAEDLVSEAFVRAFERLEDLAPTPATQAWLMRVAGNLVNRWARRRQLVGWLSLDGPERAEIQSCDEDECVARDDEVESLRAALLRLPPRFQSALALRYVEGLEVDEVARILDVSVGTVHSRLSRGRDRLRRALQRSSKP